MSQFNFTPQANPFDQIKVIIHKIKVAMGSVNQQGHFVQTHIGMNDVLPLARAAYNWGVTLPEGLVESERPNQYAIAPVSNLVAAVESHLWHTYNIPPVQITDAGPAAVSRTAFFGTLAPEVQQNVDAQRQQLAPIGGSPHVPQQPQPIAPIPSQGQIPVAPYVPPHPAAPQQQVPLGSPIQDVAPVVAPPVSPYAQLGLPDPNAPAPLPVSPLDQMGLTPPNPFTPPLASATHEQMLPVDAVMPDNTPAGKGEAQTVSGFDPMAFAQNQANGLSPYENTYELNYTGDRSVYEGYSNSDINAELLNKQIPVNNVMSREDKVAQLVGWDHKTAQEIITG